MSGWLSRLFRSRPKATPEQAQDLQRNGAVLLDVREDSEWRAGHAPGARHIPLHRLPAQSASLPPRRTVVTICRSGHRSARAVALLASQDREVINLAGGMRAWARAGLPLVAAGGRRAQVI